MIKVSDWKSYPVDEFDDYSEKFQITFTDNNICDDRGDWSDSFIKNSSNHVIPVIYNTQEVTLIIGNVCYPIQSLDSYALPDGEILIDSTSLALPELLHLFRLMNVKKRNFQVIYIQPTDYQKNSTSLESGLTFDLSDDGVGIQQLPPYVGLSTNSEIFFFLGWEGHRLGALINSEELNVKNINCLFGAPPFKLGWENRTLSNNYKQLLELNNSANPRIKIAGANDPIRTYEHIQNIYLSTEYEKLRLTLAPFGTKPAAIAAAQFAVNNANIIMLYDFAKKKLKRSTGTDLLHKWYFEYYED